MKFESKHLKNSSKRSELIILAEKNNIPIDNTLKKLQYEAELRELQSELVNLQKWMKENDYQVWFKDNSDTVFCKKGLFNLSLKEKMTLSLAMINVWFRRNKKYIKFLKR